jgi:putative transposase
VYTGLHDRVTASNLRSGDDSSHSDDHGHRVNPGLPAAGHLAGMTPHLTMAFMQQCARQLTDPIDGLLLSKRYLLHDRDTKFTRAFDELLKDSDVEPIVLPPRSPNLNAHCERFIRSIREEVLDHILILGERSLLYVIEQYLVHDHAERNHQGLDNQLIAPALDSKNHSGHARTRARLGGLLSHYYRDAA